MIIEELMSKVWEAYQGDPMDPKNNTEAGLRRVVEVVLENASLPQAVIPSSVKVPIGWTLISDKHYDALAEGLAEIKATSDGQSDQPIEDIIKGILEEIEEAEAPIQGFA